MKITPMKYNPAFLSQDDLVRSFVVRTMDLNLIIEIVKENTGNSNQHVLIIGPRGMGKTMLALRVAAHVADEKELNAGWYPIVFSEESYEISTAAEFWLRAVFHLARQTGDQDMARFHDNIKKERDEKRLYEQALAGLMDFADQRQKHLLLVVENLDMLLDEQISQDESWNLRHTLLNEKRIMLLATAVTRFDEIDNSGRAMFDLFKIHTLEPLDTKEVQTLWESLTGLGVEENRIRPIQILTGGNPRLLAIISSFAAGASFRELMKQLTFLVDEYTTYFKSNIESLPSLERKIFVTVANIWEPATAAHVAGDARVDVNKASSLLKRLESRGIVGVTKETGRKKSYQVTERLYNIYHLMRLSGSQSGRVRAVVDFMINFYEGEELVNRLSQLTEEACGLEPATSGNMVSDYYISREEDPNSPYIKFSDASILGEQRKWEKALSIAPEFLKDPKAGKQFPGDIISFFTDAAAAGFAKEGLNILRNCPCAPYVEPLIVALQMMIGEEYNAPLEVVETAKDVVKRIEEKKKLRS